MHPKKYIATFVLLLFISGAFTQSDSTWIRPQFGVGAGTFTFFGDVANNNETYGPTMGDFAYRLRVTNNVYEYIDIELHATFGRLTANERTVQRNLNFQSEIRGGGINVIFNFDPLLNPSRNISPYVSVGINSFEFLSKSDLFDANGNEYHYWSDGTIRNLPENDSQAPLAILLNRDYSFETDLRTLNIDGFGNYDEHSFSVPVGIGAKVDLSPKVHFTIGAEYHISTTDYIDNVTSESIGNRAGNDGNDKFLFSWFSLNYNFNLQKEKQPEELERFDDRLLVGLDNFDTDLDGVSDWLDKCPNTEPGIRVDENGCPLDTDKDGVPDHLDDQNNTPAGAVVDEFGVAVDDGFFLDQYMTYIDSGRTGVIEKSIVESLDNPRLKQRQRPKDKERTYFVQIGTDSDDMDVDMIEQILSIPDVRTINQGDSVMYVVGEYDDLPSAVKRKINLEQEGYSGRVISKELDTFIDVSEASDLIEGEIKEIELEKEIPEFSDIIENSDNITWRVQIGAFRYPLSENIFKTVNDVIKLTGDDGLTRYTTGSFTNIEDAAKHKINILLKGFEGAFLTAYKGGKRISIQEAGATLSGSRQSPNPNQESKSPFDKSKAFYRIQLLSYAQSIPAIELNKLMVMDDFETITVGNESYYVVGKYNSLKDAQSAMSEFDTSAFPDAKLVGEFNGNIVSSDELYKMINQ